MNENLTGQLTSAGGRTFKAHQQSGAHLGLGAGQFCRINVINRRAVEGALRKSA